MDEENILRLSLGSAIGAGIEAGFLQIMIMVESDEEKRSAYRETRDKMLDTAVKADEFLLHALPSHKFEKINEFVQECHAAIERLNVLIPSAMGAYHVAVFRIAIDQFRLKASPDFEEFKASLNTMKAAFSYSVVANEELRLNRPLTPDEITALLGKLTEIDTFWFDFFRRVEKEFLE